LPFLSKKEEVVPFFTLRWYQFSPSLKGVTNDLERRCYEHKQKIVKGFTQKYNIDKLVYFEKFDFIDSAIFREK
jgi:predicted GIY-YIG superfamily endonuclease